jgi:uncharacterized protein (TIGR03435 family)
VNIRRYCTLLSISCLLLSVPFVAAQNGPLGFGLLNARAAGGKITFDTASIKRNTSGPPPSSFNPNSPGDISTFSIPFGLADDAQTDGLFTGTNLTLLNYMVFAYDLTGNQVEFLRSQLPNWAWENTENFDIEARVKGNPTKNQMRLMMQSLLVDRFKLAMHHETLQVPAFKVVLVKPGTTGPQLQPHSDDPPCSTASASLPAKITDRFPAICGEVVRMPASAAGRVRLGARNMTMALIESTLAGYGEYGDSKRPMLDETGLSGTFDFSFEWMPQLNGSLPPGAPGEGHEGRPRSQPGMGDRPGRCHDDRPRRGTPSN